ncbi:bifunctional diguanylate cyclase/phosphodiesterase [Thalassotalea sp. M1531]|uniref:cyclic-guanylate-specific phosphodiesterase n=1 Tax=Thalassotalea algicola TaxID=2716224 RepID=A0A7Y0L9H7_9GAMM|nr:bifunctional diguanylate cyclase/phosphodiesterase [Thalassotalea algicola]NMP30247.1 bifunctional diguanylate cyclase/phosphodiesterase [Thalassotalea algicola]
MSDVKEAGIAKDPTLKLLYALSIGVVIFIAIVLFVLDGFNQQLRQQQDVILNYYDKSIAETFNLTEALQALKFELSANYGRPIHIDSPQKKAEQLKRILHKINLLQQRYQQLKFQQSVKRLNKQINQVIENLSRGELQEIRRYLDSAMHSARQINLLHQHERGNSTEQHYIEFSRVDSVIEAATLITVLIGLPLIAYILFRVKAGVQQLQYVHAKLLDTHKEVERHAYYDALTQLPNRRLFKEYLESAIENSARNGETYGVFYIDIDNFKRINDSLGHDIGDELLIEISQRILSCIRSTDMLSRIGGDEFNLLLVNVENDLKARQIAEKIIEKITKPAIIQGHEVNVSVSIGITLLPDDSRDFSTLLKYADLAMYHVKAVGKNSFKFFDKTLNDNAIANLKLEQKLKSAIERGAFELHYQPQFDIKTKRLIGFEALIRWYDDEQGNISPVVFIPLAEATGLIDKIGKWVITQVCKDINTLIAHTHANIRVAINISTRQLCNTELVKTLKESCEVHQVSPTNIEVEITESMLMDDIDEKKQLLQSLQNMGITVAIDDFGTGYSSFSYLKDLPVNTLKIDRTFIQHVCEQVKDEEIASGIIALAHSLQLKTVAEGVETQEQLSLLAQQSCDCCQGYLFSKPLPLIDIVNINYDGIRQSTN